MKHKQLLIFIFLIIPSITLAEFDSKTLSKIKNNEELSLYIDLIYTSAIKLESRAARQLYQDCNNSNTIFQTKVCYAAVTETFNLTNLRCKKILSTKSLVLSDKNLISCIQDQAYFSNKYVEWVEKSESTRPKPTVENFALNVCEEAGKLPYHIAGEDGVKTLAPMLFEFPTSLEYLGYPLGNNLRKS